MAQANARRARPIAWSGKEHPGPPHSGLQPGALLKETRASVCSGVAGSSKGSSIGKGPRNNKACFVNTNIYFVKEQRKLNSPFPDEALSHFENCQTGLPDVSSITHEGNGSPLFVHKLDEPQKGSLEPFNLLDLEACRKILTGSGQSYLIHHPVLSQLGTRWMSRKTPPPPPPQKPLSRNRGCHQTRKLSL